MTRLHVSVTIALCLAPTTRALEPAPTSKRPAWTTSHIAGSPEPPPPYVVADAFPGIRFKTPVMLTNAPGTNRLFVVEVTGKLYSFLPDREASKTDLFFDLLAHQPDTIQAYGIAFHPQFAMNRFVYLCYVLKGEKPDSTRVSRFTVSNTDPPAVDPKSERLLLTFLGGGHNGGCLKFGPDGYLYITTGDGCGPSPPDIHDTGQDISDLLSSILRIDVDKEEGGKPYATPADNPFVRVAGARPEVWAYGFRNPWQMSFDPKTGDLWVGDVGWDLWELVYRVAKGGNYGWSVVEGRQEVRPTAKRGPTPILPPTVDHPHSESRSITGGHVYYGSRLPELAGRYIYGDFTTGKLFALKHDGQTVVERRELTDSTLQIVGFGEDNGGELYILDYEPTGKIYRLERNSAVASARPFPRKLSETGLFAEVATLKPAAGVVPYSVAIEPWMDGATAERLLALPGESQLGMADNGKIAFPPGAVLAKTVLLPIASTGESHTRRMETQILHFEEGTWRPYAYVWNDEQTDAELAPNEGLDRLVHVPDPTTPGSSREQVYRVASRAECNLCHTAALDSLLGATALQLNRTVDRGVGAENQLDAWARLGIWAKPLTKKTAEWPRLPSPTDRSQSLEARSRAYLYANCQHCHRLQGAGTATINLDFELPLDKTLTVDAKPAQGTFGLTDARIIAPGDPYASVLFYRMAKTGRGRMPHVGSSVVDDAAVAMMEEWIRSMKPGGPVKNEDAPDLVKLTNKSSSSADLGAPIERLLSRPSGSLRLCRAIVGGRVDAAVRAKILAVAARHPDGAVREMFERFIPPSQRPKRLGERFRPEDVLSLKGNAERGRQSYHFGAAAQCKTCHRIHDEGGMVGPDLSKIGAKYLKPALLETIVDPSKQIEPAFASRLIATTSGEVFLGLLVSQTKEEWTLRDARGATIRVPAAQVESVAVQTKSLMPDLLLRDFTAQEAADLLEYLASLR